MSALLDGMVLAAQRAGQAILEIYADDDFGVETKDDDSPLTRADMAAHRVIIAALADLAPDLPVMSEESDGIPYAVRSGWERYFLVDPLDGTKEFINRNGEFTVNIALIDHGRPVLGVVSVPVKDVTYVGDIENGQGAWILEGGKRRTISVRQLAEDAGLTVVASRRHGGEALARFMDALSPRFPRIDTTSMGSSLKFCLVAEGLADFYPRLAPTSEWDTAAAQAVVEAAGGAVLATDLTPLRYNRGESVLNPHFLVFGDTSYSWADVLPRDESA